MPFDEQTPRTVHSVIPPESTPPHTLSDEYIRDKLERISATQSRQARIEAERTGASQTTSRLIAIFGALMTAAAIGGFGWVWSTSSQIQRLEERQRTHDPDPPGHNELEQTARATERRLDGVERTTKVIDGRLDRMEREQTARHEAVLEELRRLRGRRYRTAR